MTDFNDTDPFDEWSFTSYFFTDSFATPLSTFDDNADLAEVDPAQPSLSTFEELESIGVDVSAPLATSTLLDKPQEVFYSTSEAGSRSVAGQYDVITPGSQGGSQWVSRTLNPMEVMEMAEPQLRKTEMTGNSGAIPLVRRENPESDHAGKPKRYPSIIA